MSVLRREKVAILGYVEDTLWQAPFEDRSWKRENGCEIWGLNDLWRKNDNTGLLGSKGEYGDRHPPIRFDRWFELHSLGKSDEEHIRWLEKCGVTVYLNSLPKTVRIAQALRYPLEEVVAHFGTRYFTNTISYEIALAIVEGFKEIALYGVNMATWENEAGPNELGEQRPSIEFFLGWARAKGIKLTIPEASDLLKTAVIYGFEEHADSLRQKVHARRRAYQASSDRYQAAADLYRGKAQGIEEIERTWMPAEL